MAKDLSVATLLDTYGNMLTTRQKDIVGYYYCDDLSLAEIAENEGITRGIAVHRPRDAEVNDDITLKTDERCRKIVNLELLCIFGMPRSYVI